MTTAEGAAPGPVLQLLLIDDDLVDRQALRRALVQSGLAVETADAEDVAQACAHLAARRFDVVFCDHYLPDGDGLEVFDQRGELNAFTPFVALTGQGDELLAADIMRRGATDYLPKSQVSAARIKKCVFDALRVRDLEARARNALQDALAAARARDAVMAVVSHDLRSPLGTLAMGAGLLREAILRRGAAAASELTTLERMERACKRMQSLMADLEDVARSDAGTFHLELGSVRVDEVLREAVDAAQMQAQAVGVEVRCTGVAVELSLEVDRQRIQQALGNLVGNALKVTAPRGVITLRAELVDGFVRLEVGDTGAGLEPEHAARAFDRYWQGPSGTRGSTGMGLFIVRTIAEAHGGRAEVRSERGRGSTFSLLLPRVR